MKNKFSKFLTLFFCLVMGMNVWGADPTLSSVDWPNSNPNTVFADIFKTHDCGVTLGTDATAWKGNFDGHYFICSGGGTDLSATTWANYMSIVGTSKIDSIAVLWIPNGTSATNVAWCGWETAVNRVVDAHGETAALTSSKSYDSRAWQTIDLTSHNLKIIYLSRQFKKVKETEGGSDLQFGKNATVNIVGIKVWLHSDKVVDHTTVAVTDVKVNGTAQDATFTAGVWNAPETPKYAEEPAVKFVKTTTTYYTDGTDDGGKNEDVDAEVAKNANLWVATATINETSYTANLPVDADPVMNLSPENGTLPLGVAPSKSLTVTLTGANLTDGEYNVTVPSVDGLSIAPAAFTVADGAVNQEFTITYASTADVAEANAVLTFSDGTTSKTFTLTYSSVSAYDLQDVSEAITWDWSKLSVAVNAPAELQGDGGIKLSDETTPSISDEVLYANAYYISVAAGFDAQKIAFIGQYPVRSKMCQNGTIKFHTTIPGYITVKFSDTGSSVDAKAHKRYLNVNGVNTEYWTSRPTSGSTKSNDTKTSGKIFVPAGDVTIKAMKEDGENPTAICVYIVTFTPAYTREIDQIGTICLANGIESYTGATLYEISHKVVENDIVKSIVLVEATEFEAGRPYIFEPVDNATTLTCELNSTVAAVAGSHNGLIGSYTTEYITGAEDNNTDIYVVYNNKVMLCGTNNKVGANRAYIKMSDVRAEQPASLAGRRQLVINNANAPQTPTDIESVSAETAAQKVMINGQVFILRGEKLFDTVGRQVK